VSGCFGLSRAAQKQLAGGATGWFLFGCLPKPSGFFCEPFFKRGGVLDPLTLHGAVLHSPGFYNSKNDAGVLSVHFLTQANQATAHFKLGHRVGKQASTANNIFAAVFTFAPSVPPTER
jgi:hypothetical protein